MRRFFAIALLLLMAAGNSGCLLNLYSPDPNERMEQLIFQSEDYRQMKNEWKRFWFTDQPSHLTYERVHGGIGP